MLQASSLSEGGEVFLLDMGDPIKIHDLARDMITLSGLRPKSADQPNGDIEIVETGLRPGEKLYEEMFISDDSSTTSVAKIFVGREHMLLPSVLSGHLQELTRMADERRPDELVKLLFEVIDPDAQGQHLPADVEFCETAVV